MYGIFTYIYHKNQPNVGKYAMTMDPMEMDETNVSNLNILDFGRWLKSTTPWDPGLLWQPLPPAMAQHVVARWETHSGLVLLVLGKSSAKYKLKTYDYICIVILGCTYIFIHVMYTHNL